MSLALSFGGPEVVVDGFPLVVEQDQFGGPLALEELVDPLFVIESDVLENLPDIEERSFLKVIEMPLLEVLQTIIFPMARVSKVSLVIGPDEIIVLRSLLAALHMFLVIVGRITLTSAGTESLHI